MHERPPFDPDSPELQALVDLVGKGGVVTLTGAGISTDSGIPDFRGPQGVWTKDPASQALFTLASYVADPEVRRRSWVSRREHPAWAAEPNSGHRALVALERAGRLSTLVTQNIDGLHQRAGTSAATLVEIHGTLLRVGCLSCGREWPMRHALDRVEAGDPDPACAVCGGLLKSATISFGQPLVPAVLERAVAAAAGCQVFLAVGTSLTVSPAADLPAVALRAGARLVVVNAEPTPYDGVAHAVVREPIGTLLPELVRRVAGGYEDAGAPSA